MKKVVDTTCFSVAEVQKRLCAAVDYLRLSGERTMISLCVLKASDCVAENYSPVNPGNWEFAPAFDSIRFEQKARTLLKLSQYGDFSLRKWAFLMTDPASFVKHAISVLNQKYEATSLFALFFVSFYRRSDLNKTGSLIKSRDSVICIGSHHHAPRYCIKDSIPPGKDIFDEDCKYYYDSRYLVSTGMIDSFYESLQY
jgi:hypothetical protein